MPRNTPSEPAIRPVRMGLFPTSGSLQEAMDLALSRLPVLTGNEMRAIIFNYHNTLLQEIERHGSQDQSGHPAR